MGSLNEDQSREERLRRIRRGGRPRKGDPIIDHFGNDIEVGDRYFYGSPPTHGVVLKLRTSSIMIEVGSRLGVSSTMDCKSPRKGICIDKVPDDIFSTS